MKLAIVLENKDIPEELKKKIEEFTIPQQFLRFFEKYGPRAIAQYDGIGFVSDRHPRIASAVRDRYTWLAFSTERMEWPETMNMQIAKQLEGFMVLIVYRNSRGSMTRMDPKRVGFAANEYMHVDHGTGAAAGGFTLSYRGIVSITLYVDVPR